MKQNNSIPSDEDFKRASDAIKKRSQGLTNVRAQILANFQAQNEIYDFYIFDSSETSFVSYIFFRWSQQVSDAEKSGLKAKIIDSVYQELEKEGRGGRDMIHVNFEFDSHENVEHQYDGDYFSRLR